MKFRDAAFVSILLSLSLAGCEATQEQRAGTGALIGAVAGTASAPPSTEYCRFRRPDGTIYTARCP